MIPAPGSPEAFQPRTGAISLDHRDIGYALLRGCGIEIGPGLCPARVPAPAQLRFCDLMSPAAWRQFSGGLPDLPGADPGSRLGGGHRPRGPASADGSQDFVIANHLLEVVADPIATLAECCRVLRPGGRLVISASDKHLAAALRAHGFFHPAGAPSARYRQYRGRRVHGHPAPCPSRTGGQSGRRPAHHLARLGDRREHLRYGPVPCSRIHQRALAITGYGRCCALPANIRAGSISPCWP